MRDVVYFQGHGATGALLVLGAIAAYNLRDRAKSAPSPSQPAPVPAG
jgi:hypothetical protein